MIGFVIGWACGLTIAFVLGRCTNAPWWVLLPMWALTALVIVLSTVRFVEGR